MTLQETLNSRDKFARKSGVVLTETGEGHATAVMTVTADHLNAGGVCQGGALFTLADLALAAVMNSHGKLTFGIESQITFLHSAFEGDVLTAEAKEIYNHHRIPYCEVKIRNQHDRLVCVMTGLAFRKDQPFGGEEQEGK